MLLAKEKVCSGNIAVPTRDAVLSVTLQTPAPSSTQDCDNAWHMSSGRQSHIAPKRGGRSFKGRGVRGRGPFQFPIPERGTPALSNQDET